MSRCSYCLPSPNLQHHSSGMPACPYTDVQHQCPDGECSWSDSQAMDREASAQQTSQEEYTAKKLNYAISEPQGQTWFAPLWSGWCTHNQCWHAWSQQVLYCTTQSPAGAPFRYLHSILTEWLNSIGTGCMFWRLRVWCKYYEINNMRGWPFWNALPISRDKLGWQLLEWRHFVYKQSVLWNWPQLMGANSTRELYFYWTILLLFARWLTLNSRMPWALEGWVVTQYHHNHLGSPKHYQAAH